MRSLLDWMRRLMFSVTLSASKGVGCCCGCACRDASHNFREVYECFEVAL